MEMTSSRTQAIILTSLKLLFLTNLIESDGILRQYIINVSITEGGVEEARYNNFYINDIKE
jgi:hypothetical protein